MINLIPMAREVRASKGVFRLKKDSAVYSEIELPLVKNKGDKDSPVKIFREESLGKEAYRAKTRSPMLRFRMRRSFSGAVSTWMKAAISSVWNTLSLCWMICSV